jgi:multidrug efflux pump subunit AcrB
MAGRNPRRHPDQVTERIEQTLKETPNLDFLRSFTSAGVTTIFVTLKGARR